MEFLQAILGFILLAAILWDAFEVVILPRRVVRRLKLTRLLFRATWTFWSALGQWMTPGRRRETYLSLFGPLLLLLVLAVWAFGLVLAFALLHWGTGSRFNVVGSAGGFATHLYMSGTTFFTLGLGDVAPNSAGARLLTVVEAGLGFIFLAITIAYLPALYQAFSRREVSISLLDARAGSPPSAAGLLRRYGHEQNFDALAQLLREWEHWAAEVLESHLSYPVLGYFRSQHNNQSWLAALTTILDTCALIIIGTQGAVAWQARLTFAMARHAAVDLAQVYDAPPRPPHPDRLPSTQMAELQSLAESGLPLCDIVRCGDKLAHLRRMYEPYVNSLAEHLLMPLPSWVFTSAGVDNWQTTAWERVPARFETSAGSDPEDSSEEHPW